MTLMEEAFKDINFRDYAMKVVETETYTEATVTKNVVNFKNYTVMMPKEERLGSRFGAAPVGSRPRMASPASICIVVLVKSYGHGLTRIGIMPYWLTTATGEFNIPKTSTAGLRLQ